MNNFRTMMMLALSGTMLCANAQNNQPAQFVKAPKVQVQKGEKTLNTQWNGAKVAFLGDSMTDKRRIGTTCVYWEYLEELLELGIGGLLFFLIAWLSIPLCTKKEGQQTALLFTTLFLFNMCTECVFGRYDGIALWAVGMVFILMQCSPYLSNSPRK